MTPDFWRGKRVLVTGHTGFKGSWLCQWLASLGAHVHGYSLAPPTQPNLFEVARVRSLLGSHTIDDVRNLDALRACIARTDPDVVFHAAAQSLVTEGYAEPLATFAVNIMGTVNVLEALRDNHDRKRAVVCITSDKCYRPESAAHAFVESDPLGGNDPYSASKAAAEIVVSAYRTSFFTRGATSIATARAGNVIGGGDWSANRLVPDILRAADAHQPLRVRMPAAIRPWQHVLEPVHGYLMLAERLASAGEQVASGWNFGPGDAGCSVQSLLEMAATRLPDFGWYEDASGAPAETWTLQLDSSRARRELGWQPRWSVAEAIDRVLSWHRAWRDGEDMQHFCRVQIEEFLAAEHA